MNVAGRPYRTIWRKPDDERVVQLIDQRALPHRFVVEEVRTVEQMAAAIREMHVRGAPLIGAAAAYGMYLAMLAEMEASVAAALLRATRTDRSEFNLGDRTAIVAHHDGRRCDGKN
jgi:methylthioribose-1-phosphate isomerase